MFAGQYEEVITFLKAIKNNGPQQYHMMMCHLFDAARFSLSFECHPSHIHVNYMFYSGPDSVKPQKTAAYESLALLNLTGMKVDCVTDG